MKNPKKEKPLQLLDLIAEIKGVFYTPENIASSLSIRGMTSDSRDLRPGFLFAAFPGAKVDGRDFIAQAIEQGATAILAPTGTTLPAGSIAVLITHDQPRLCFSKMVSTFYGRQPKTIVAVTGTNGKSSTVTFCRQIWQSMDHAAASLGTIGITVTGKDISPLNKPGILTTPDPVVLHTEIAELEAAGVTHLALEASSIGLDQYRLDGLNITTAGFSNFTHDHLDYHGDMETYFAAKTRLFTDLLTDKGIAVIHTGTDYAQKLIDICHAKNMRVIDVGHGAKDINIITQKPTPTGQFLEITVMGEKYAFELPLIGAFQAENALLALGLVLAENPDHIPFHCQGVAALEKLQSVRGRLEHAGSLKNGAHIYVDYAHTPDGLETMLNSIRPHVIGKLHVVFGCGGDRDKTKRPKMGAIAQRLSDVAIVTDDNPRTEDADTIRSEVMTGCPTARNIGGRAKAIETAIHGLNENDILVIAGKGHEQGQIIGKTVHPFDDVTIAKKIITEMG